MTFVTDRTMVLEDENDEYGEPDDGFRPDSWIEGTYYYTFLADDGTIRRACMSPEGPFPWGESEKPKGVPRKVELYHVWSVDVLPVRRNVDLER